MKVIIALDDSPYSVGIIDEVINRHWAADTNFKLLRVIEPVNSIEQDMQNWAEAIQLAHARRYDNAVNFLAATRDRLTKKLPGSHVHYDIREGYPNAEIIDAAVEWSADKIIVGAHGKDVCPRFLLGSVSKSVATHAPCSVEIIRSQPVGHLRAKSKEHAAVKK